MLYSKHGPCAALDPAHTDESASLKELLAHGIAGRAPSMHSALAGTDLHPVRVRQPLRTSFMDAYTIYFSSELALLGNGPARPIPLKGTMQSAGLLKSRMTHCLCLPHLKLMILSNLSATREAPPTNAPSMSAQATRA